MFRRRQHSHTSSPTDQGNILKPYERLSIDSPKRSVIDNQEVRIRGWVIAQRNAPVKAARVKNNNLFHDIEFGLERQDVANVVKGYDPKPTLYSGFEGSFLFEDGTIDVQLDFGNGFVSVYKKSIKYSVEQLYETYLNSKLSANWAEHKNLLQNKKDYYYEEEQKGAYARGSNDPRLVAFYLPQFHPIKENDKAWGKGFTEWTNVTSAQARFVGHQQPVLPADMGYYDLRLESNVFKQIELAKKYGIYGFCFYYYWFSGTKLLDTPIRSFLKHKEWDFNFMICWANENWTKRWDGRDSDIIIAQRYLEDDPIRFIKDVEPILLDKRYIRNNGKPVLAVYRGTELGDPEKYVKEWRKYFKNKHGLELELITMMNFDPDDPRADGFDRGVEFAPLTDYRHSDFDKTKYRIIGMDNKLIDPNFEGQVVDYRAFSTVKRTARKFTFPTYLSLAPSWDNEARKKGKGSLTLYGSNPDLYSEWLVDIIHNATQSNGKNSLVFVNAWNEWAEGTMLEPNTLTGHAVLKRTREVLSQSSSVAINRRNFPRYGVKPTAALAIVVHVYYKDKWEYIKKRLNAINGLKYDLFVTLTIKDSKLAKDIKNDFPNANVYVVPNRGRDVLPFLFIAGRLEQIGYEYMLKLHTKKSLHREDGDKWFEDLLDKLLPGKKSANDILSTLEQGVAMVGPSGHYISCQEYIGGNKQCVLSIVERLYGASAATNLFERKRGFFAGTMFWCRMDSIRPLLQLRLIPEDFEAEKGQIDGTLAHSVERVISMLPALAEKEIYTVSKRQITRVNEESIITDYTFATTDNRI